jgi:Arc/MetJ family transcription regulator
MIKRTTIELDQELLNQAKKALGESTTRGAVEAALRKVTEAASSRRERRTEALEHYLQQLSELADLETMSSEEMWR